MNASLQLFAEEWESRRGLAGTVIPNPANSHVTGVWCSAWGDDATSTRVPPSSPGSGFSSILQPPWGRASNQRFPALLLQGKAGSQERLGTQGWHVAKLRHSGGCPDGGAGAACMAGGGGHRLAARTSHVPSRDSLLVQRSHPPPGPPSPAKKLPPSPAVWFWHTNLWPGRCGHTKLLLGASPSVKSCWTLCQLARLEGTAPDTHLMPRANHGVPGAPWHGEGDSSSLGPTDSFTCWNMLWQR